MNIQIASDLHLDYNRSYSGLKTIPLKVRTGVLVMAGDLCERKSLGKYLHKLCNMFQEVIYIPGNHDYYGSWFPGTKSTLNLAQEKNINLHVLDNKRKEIRGQWFAGTTLWFRNDPNNQRYSNQLADFSVIKEFVPAVYEENEKALDFLKTIKPEDIVVTHHIPHPTSIAECYRNNELNRFFLCDVSDVISKQPLLWIHGHTHKFCDYKIGRTRIVCNPLGYMDLHESSHYDSAMIVEISEKEEKL